MSLRVMNNKVCCSHRDKIKSIVPSSVTVDFGGAGNIAHILEGPCLSVLFDDPYGAGILIVINRSLSCVKSSTGTQISSKSHKNSVGVALPAG